MAFLIAAAFALAVAAWLAAEPLLRRARRRRLQARPFPAPWARLLRDHVPLYNRLPTPLRERLERRIHVFLDEKSFIGCAGFEITQEARVVIAAQACVLALERRELFPNLREILVYPGPFVVERTVPGPSGVLQESRSVLSGESWTRGQVILSWQDVLDGAAIPDDGRNVVIHEFAHQLDQEKGHANGAPFLGSARRYERWSSTFAREFAQLQQQAALGLPTLFSNYGATDPAEFFAVASEVFLEQPREMAGLHPQLYAELRDYYRLDPAAW